MKLTVIVLSCLLALAGMKIATLQDTIYEQESYIDMLQDTVLDYEEEVE